MNKAIEKAKILIENAVEIDNKLENFLDNCVCNECSISQRGQCKPDERCGAYILLKKLIYIYSMEI